MIPKLKKERQIAEKLAERPLSFQAVRRQIRQKPLNRWALRGLYLLLFVALFGDFIANQKPLYCVIEGKTWFPVGRQYLVDLGLAKWDVRFLTKPWPEQQYDRVIMPLIPYSAQQIDLKNGNYRSPFGPQSVKNWRYRHWLGTDQLGRDVTAGLIAGSRTAILVGFVAMSIAALIGVFFGAVAGYFGDDRLRLSFSKLIFLSLGLFLGIFWAFGARSYALTEGRFGLEFVKSLLILSLVLALFYLLARLAEKAGIGTKRASIQADNLVMRLIDVVNSVPVLLFVLAALALIKERNILYVMAIIGLLRWTGVARFLRAELLRVRKMEYMEAAKALGFSDWRIIRRHAIPNSIGPVMIALAFGIAGAVLVEAFLSFLGIGLPPESVSWGSMLNHVRSNFAAWWLALFPGLAIFFTVMIFNLLGESLTEVMDPRGGG